MRYLLYTDVHLSQTSSIIRGNGARHSLRLENVIKSVNWAEDLAVNQKCDAVICLGDFFQSANLNSYEITALKDIKWNSLKHIFLVGNHESEVTDLEYTSVDALSKMPNFQIIKQPTVDFEFEGNTRLVFIPYITERNLLSLDKYIYPHDYNTIEPEEKVVVFSHNSVKGIQMGPVLSREGIDVTEIDDLCTIFLNGHLHNGTKFSKKGINLGNLTGQNFGEDATKYEHGCFILDTQDFSLEFYENPHAFNFYPMEILCESDLNKLDNIKNNAVINFKVKKSAVTALKDKLSKCSNIAGFHTYIIPEVIKTGDKIEVNLISKENTDHLTQFKVFMEAELGSTAAVLEEIDKVIL